MDVQDLRDFAKRMKLADLATYLMRTKREPYVNDA
jgi:hypothetical protein